MLGVLLTLIRARPVPIIIPTDAGFGSGCRAKRKSLSCVSCASVLFVMYSRPPPATGVAIPQGRFFVSGALDVRFRGIASTEAET